MKVVLHYEDNADSSLHKSLRITLPKSWKTGPSSRLLDQFVESYNATFKERNELDGSSLHLAMRVSTSSTNDHHEIKALASDDVVIDTIPDRSDVFILHGPSRTKAEIEEEARKLAEEKRLERERTVPCTNFGCKRRIPRGGPYPECQHHVAPPVFHETAKFWSCCPQKKAYDWDEFQSIPGCKMGRCSETKSDEKQFLGGCDLREKNNGPQLKSIDDFNKGDEAKGAPVLSRLRSIAKEIGVENELFDQVVEGIRNETNDDDLIATEIGKKIKDMFKGMAVEQLKIG